MKKLALTLLALSSAVVLGSCGNNTQTNMPNNGGTNTPTTQKQSFKGMAETSALSSISMLNNPVGAKALRRAALTEEQKSKVLEQLDLVDELLKGDSIKSEEVAVPEGDQYHGVYDKYYTLTVNQIDGKREDYKFYYKETLAKPEVEEEEAKPEGQKKAKEGEQTPTEEAKPEALAPSTQESVEEEVSSDLDGVVILGEKTYKMHGDKEVTKEGQEVEIEFSFVITDEETKEKVVVKQETETGGGENENEYAYSKFDANGKLVEKVKIELEQENNETEYSVKSMTNGDKKQYKFKFEEKDGQKFVKVKIVENKEVIQAKLVFADEGYKFVE